MTDDGWYGIRLHRGVVETWPCLLREWHSREHQTGCGIPVPCSAAWGRSGRSLGKALPRPIGGAYPHADLTPTIVAGAEPAAGTRKVPVSRGMTSPRRCGGDPPRRGEGGAAPDKE